MNLYGMIAFVHVAAAVSLLSDSVIASACAPLFGVPEQHGRCVRPRCT
jgi:hypothetical protein